MKIWRVAFVMTVAALSLASCSSDYNGDMPVLIIDPVETNLEKPTATTTLSLSNAPIIDGSDSTEPLRNLLMCRLLGIDCQWRQRLQTDGTWCVIPQWHSLSDEDNKTLQRILENRNTHDSFVSLIDGENGIIITARGVSRDEQKYADEKGVQLLSRPVAKDAFVFIVNPKNPVRNLTIEQIQKIYTGEIRNWKEVGSNDATINTQVIGVNGIAPSKQTIEDDSYPYVTHVMASVRADIDKSSTAYQLFYQLATGQHNDIVKESGYIIYQ